MYFKSHLSYAHIILFAILYHKTAGWRHFWNTFWSYHGHAMAHLEVGAFCSESQNHPACLQDTSQPGPASGMNNSTCHACTFFINLNHVCDDNAKPMLNVNYLNAASNHCHFVVKNFLLLQSGWVLHWLLQWSLPLMKWKHEKQKIKIYSEVHMENLGFNYFNLENIEKFRFKNKETWQRDIE